MLYLFLVAKVGLIPLYPEDDLDYILESLSISLLSYELSVGTKSSKSKTQVHVLACSLPLENLGVRVNIVVNNT